MSYDVFISHASEDKAAVVRPLAQRLKALGLRVWLDETELTIGDSLRRSIDRGLTNSRFGVVVLSRSFFDKEWPNKELDGLVAREDGKSKVILPIWHEVTRDEVARFSSILADRLASSTSAGLDAVANEIAQAVARGPSRSTDSLEAALAQGRPGRQSLRLLRDRLAGKRRPLVLSLAALALLAAGLALLLPETFVRNHLGSAAQTNQAASIEQASAASPALPASQLETQIEQVLPALGTERSKWHGNWVGEFTNSLQAKEREKKSVQEKYPKERLRLFLNVKGETITGTIYHMWSAPHWIWHRKVTGTLKGTEITFEETFKREPEFISYRWQYVGSIDESEESIRGTWKGERENEYGTFYLRKIR